MILIVKDEDPPTVAAAINAFAQEEGLDTVDLSATSQNPFEMLGILAGPRVLVVMSEDQVVATGLESLDIAEPEEWGTAISTACESEVIVIDALDNGLHVFVFDGGELDETIEVPFTAANANKKTDTSRLVELADSDEGRSALEKGITSPNVSDLLQSVLKCLGASSPDKESPVMLAFHDPLDEEGEDGDGNEGENVIESPALVAVALPAASLEGKVGAPVTSIRGTIFGVNVVGVPEVEGVRISIGGDALTIMSVDVIEIDLRHRGTNEITRRAVKLDDETKKNASNAEGKGVLVIDLPDAYLEHVEDGPPQIDMTDLFSSMQRLMSAGTDRALNTLMVQVNGTGLRAGEAMIALEATAIASSDSNPNPIASGAAVVPVRVL